MRGLRAILNGAIDQDLIRDRPPPGTMTIVLADDDGLVVSQTVSHQLLEDVPPTVIAPLFDELLSARKQLRAGQDSRR